MGFLDYNGLKYWYSKILTRFKNVDDKISNIQTTSRATLSQAGWYRVAEYDCSAYPEVKKGLYANGCDLHIQQIATQTSGSDIMIRLLSRYNWQRFVNMGACTHGDVITKIRYTYDSTKAYIEIYYRLNASNVVNCTVCQNGQYAYRWRKLDFVPTSETVDGVTVTTTYDIPANASPVTDLDIGYLSKAITWNRTWTSVLSVGTGIYKIGSAEIPYITDLPASVNKSGVLWLSVFKDTDENSYLLRQPMSNTTWAGSQYGSKLSWSEPLVTTADLANYFKNTGGTINGAISFKTVNNMGYGSVSKSHSETSDNGTFVTDLDSSGNILRLVTRAKDGKIIHVYNNVHNDILHTGNFTDYALPKTGGTMSVPVGKTFTIQSYYDSTGHHDTVFADGALKLVANTVTIAPGQTRISGTCEIDGNMALHTGISAKTVIDVNEPSTMTNTLWVVP